jgi:hypothetical protein
MHTRVHTRPQRSHRHSQCDTHQPDAQAECHAVNNGHPDCVIVHAVIDDALSPDFPLGVDLEVFNRRQDGNDSSRRFAAMIPN